jgi:hypothetical protein
MNAIHSHAALTVPLNTRGGQPEPAPEKLVKWKIVALAGNGALCAAVVADEQSVPDPVEIKSE